jgi:hypothetical protein
VAGALAFEVDDALLDRALGAVDVLDKVDQPTGVVEGTVLNLVRRDRFGRLFFGALRSSAFSTADFGASAVSLTTSSTTSSAATRSSTKSMVNPLLRKAISWRRRATVSKSYSSVSKMFGSAQNRTVVPVFLVFSPCLRVPGTDRS